MAKKYYVFHAIFWREFLVQISTLKSQRSQNQKCLILWNVSSMFHKQVTSAGLLSERVFCSYIEIMGSSHATEIKSLAGFVRTLCTLVFWIVNENPDWGERQYYVIGTDYPLLYRSEMCIPWEGEETRTVHITEHSYVKCCTKRYTLIRTHFKWQSHHKPNNIYTN